MGGLGTVEGIVTDSGTGLPVAGAQVQKVGGYNMDTTDADGYFRMTMPIGDIELAVTKFGYFDGAVSVTILDDLTVNADLAIDLLPSATVSGIVYGPDDSGGRGRHGARGQHASGSGLFRRRPATTPWSCLSGAGEIYDMVGRASGMGTQAQTIELLGDLTLDFNLPEWIGDDFETGNFNRFPWELTGNADWIIDTGRRVRRLYTAPAAVISATTSPRP